jgi:hypothetical protein
MSFCIFNQQRYQADGTRNTATSPIPETVSRHPMTLTKEQVRSLLNPPVAYVDPIKSEIDIRRRNFIYCTKGLGTNIYSGTYIVDSEGNSFRIKKVQQSGKVLFWTSLAVFSPIVEVLPEVDEVVTLSVDQFRTLMLDTVKRKPKAWSSLDTVENIRKSLVKCTTYFDIMKVFHRAL